jgi:hypothetical protein
MALDTEAGTITFRVTTPTKEVSEVQRALKGNEFNNFNAEPQLTSGTYRWQASIADHVLRSGTIVVRERSELGTQTATLTDDGFRRAPKR